MPSPGASAKAELIGTGLETLCYGIYLMVFYKTLKVLGAKYTEGRPIAVMLCTALIIFVLVTVHLAMDLVRVYQAFTDHMNVPNSPILYYSVVRRSLDLIKSGCYVVCTVVADGLITYRTHVVWGRNWKLTVIPFVLVLADIGTGTYALWLLCITRPEDNVLMGEVTTRVRYFYAVTLALNLVCSLLISYKIWRVQQEVDRYSPTAMRPISGSRLVLVIIESAAIYTTLLLVLIVTSIIGTPATLAMLDLIAPCIGIIFSMVIVCVSVDSTRWDSIKISTHLNFVSGFNMSATSVQQGSNTNSPADDKVKVEHHVQTPVFSYSERGGSMASLPDIFV